MRLVKRLGRGLLRLILGLVVVYAVLSVVGALWVEREIARIRASGAPVSPTEFAKPPIPESDNAAPLYLKAAKQLKEAFPQDGYDIVYYYLSRSMREAYPDLRKEAADVVRKCRLPLALAQEAASLPQCRFPIRWQDGMETKFPHLAPLGDLADLASADAIVDAYQGRMDEALTSVGLGYRLADSIKDEPCLIQQLVRWELMRKASASLRESLRHGDITERQALRLYKTISRISPEKQYVECMLGERAVGIDIFAWCRRHPIAAADWVWGGQRGGYTMKPGITNDDIREMLAPVWAWLPTSYADQVYYLKSVDKWIARANVPYRVMNSRYRRITPESLPAYAVLSEILVFDYHRLGMRRDHAVATLAGDRIFLMLAVYKARYGAYPRTLDVLSASLKWDPPEDPFSGKDFVYRPEGKGFVLYSIGDDLKDGGAKPVPRPLPAPPPVPAPATPPSQIPVEQNQTGPQTPPPPTAPPMEDPRMKELPEYRYPDLPSPEYTDIIWWLER